MGEVSAISKTDLADTALRQVVWVGLGALAIALSAQVAVPLPFTPVPTTFQAQAVLVISALLGAKRGFAAALAYLAMGAMGLPVFALASGGWWHLFGPTAGYLWAYLPVSYCVGWVAPRVNYSILPMALVWSIGNAAVLVGGLLWLTCLLPFTEAWALGVVPFVVTDLLKIAMALCVLPTLRNRFGTATRVG